MKANLTIEDIEHIGIALDGSANELLQAAGDKPGLSTMEDRYLKTAEKLLILRLEIRDMVQFRCRSCSGSGSWKEINQETGNYHEVNCKSCRGWGYHRDEFERASDDRLKSVGREPRQREKVNRIAGGTVAQQAAV